ncbi:bifunctional Translation protein SH3-like domain superfamily/Ribosomal protein L26-L24 [Babesia duncani]|uniref:Bifunctional Translation protein SH3-like domain superfamily/Ribosomal protein L26-L24 n=1 Tax=Babesia duncani TaxID=323732 RepID=A0AAD9PIR5_9APIC|nr:bifunctional Translation protein SH3-like domain superfamily/Ribosomal protein L26-L24 [Babesia duncani]
MPKFAKFKRLALEQSRSRSIPNRNYFLNFSKYRSIPAPLQHAKPSRRVDLARCFNIQVGDLVQVLAGQDENRKGIVLRIFKSRNQLIVENCNMVSLIQY